MKRKIKMGDNAQVEADVQKETPERSAHIMSSKENKVAKSMSEIKDIEKPEVKEKEEEIETEFLNDILAKFQTTETAPPTDIKTQNAYADEIKTDHFDDDEEEDIIIEGGENLADEFEDGSSESEEFNLDEEGDASGSEESEEFNLDEEGDEGENTGENTNIEGTYSAQKDQPVDIVQAAFSEVFKGDIPKYSDNESQDTTEVNQSKTPSSNLSRKERIQREDDEVKSLIEKNRKANQDVHSSMEILDGMEDQLNKAVETVKQSNDKNLTSSSEYEDNLNKLLGDMVRVVEDSVQDAAKQVPQELLKTNETLYTKPPTENYSSSQILGFNEEFQLRSQELDEQERQQLAELEQIEAQRREQDKKLQEIAKRQQEIAQQREAIKAKEEEQRRKLAEQKEQQRQLNEAQNHLDDLKDEVKMNQQILQNGSDKAEYVNNIRKAKDIKDAARAVQEQLEQSIQDDRDDFDTDIQPGELESLLTSDTQLIESLTATINKTQNSIEGLQNTSPESYQAAAKPFNINEQLASIKVNNKTISYIAIKRKLKDSLLKTLVETGLYYIEIENKEYPASVVPTGTKLIQMGDKYYCAYMQVPSIYSGYRTPLIEFMNNLTDILKNLVVTGKAEISLVNGDNMSILTQYEFGEIEGFLTQNDVTHRIEGTSLILTC